MIKYNMPDFLQNGFEHRATLVDGLNDYIYRGETLTYVLSLDDNKNQVAISGDTSHPFSSESLYEFYVPCELIVYKSHEEIDYRNFHLSFYRKNEESKESLVLTVAGRKSDGELVVWPYFSWE